MPGNVENVVVTTVMPWFLAQAFQRSRSRPLLENRYCDGENQRTNLTGSSRKRWSIGYRLSPADLVTMRDFYEARRGSHQAFLFYDIWFADPLFAYDETGELTAGRFAVRFDMAWGQEIDWVKGAVNLELVEVN